MSGLLQYSDELLSPLREALAILRYLTFDLQIIELGEVLYQTKVKTAPRPINASVIPH